MATTQDGFDAIVMAWEADVSYNEVYHMILDWLEEYLDTIKHKDLAKGILNRMYNPDEELNDIVEDFFVADEYEPLRNEFGFTS